MVQLRVNGFDLWFCCYCYVNRDSMMDHHRLMFAISISILYIRCSNADYDVQRGDLGCQNQTNTNHDVHVRYLSHKSTSTVNGFQHEGMHILRITLPPK